MGTRLASFPNSRIQPRPARKSGTTPIVSLASGGATAHLLVAANVNRTSVMLRNLTALVDMKYGYANDINDPTKGFTLKAGESVTLDDPGDIYGYQNSGAPIDVDVDEGVG